MKVDKTLYKLNSLLNNQNHADLMLMSNQLIKAKNLIGENIQILTEYTFEFNENVKELNDLNKQLDYVNINSKTVENALLIKEQEVFEIITALGTNLENVCMN